jgi:hypothetical protein
LGLVADHHEDRRCLFRLIVFVLKTAFAAVLGVMIYGSGWLFFQSVSLMH